MDLRLPRDGPAAARPGPLSTSILAVVGRWVVPVHNEGAHAGRGSGIYTWADIDIYSDGREIYKIEDREDGYIETLA